MDPTRFDRCGADVVVCAMSNDAAVAETARNAIRTGMRSWVTVAPENR